jgi:curved DNA-binding protein CbpA
MHPAEARAILQLPEQAGASDVREAHRRLIAKVHPDTGGSADLARRVNAARDTLLEELKRR